MPRKTKEQKELENKVKTTEKTTSKKAKTVTKKTASKKAEATAKKAVSKKSEPKAKKTTSKKPVEYYDLPYRYNQTIVKVLAQTPTTLFIYWDIADKDRRNFERQYGKHFFEETKPILIIHNDTLGYQFEVEINDFANSWYLHVTDSKCDYRIELGRRPIMKTENLNVDYIYITASNEIESPNDKILFDPNQKMVYFRNVKTGQETQKELSSLSFLRNMRKIYHIYDYYKIMYQDENMEDIYNLSNPSSGSFSSKFK